MTQEAVREYARSRKFHPQTVARLMSREPSASAALGRLALALKIGENHLRDLMDWLDEIALRDHCDIAAVLASKVIENIETDPRLGRADKLKRIKEEIRRRRFPRLAQTEDMLKAHIAELKLHPEITLSAPVALEGGSLRIEFNVSSQQELQRLAAKLADAAQKDATREVFALLAGVPAEDETKS
jgi:hypothetical protein